MLKTFCKYTVTVHRKDQVMTKIVNEDSFTIGRSMDCTIPLHEDSISRVHLVVHRRQDQIWIEDKGSSNGTFVNNVRIAQSTLVSIVPNDRIRVGKSDYVLSIALEVEQRDEGGVQEKNPDTTELLKSPVSEKALNQTQAPPLQPRAQQQQQQASVFNPSLQPVKSIVREKTQAPVATPAPNPNPNPASAQAQNPAPTQASEPQPQSVQKPDVRSQVRPAPVDNQGTGYNTPQFEGEKILHEAHKKAAQIIYDGEVQAEKRAQSIYMEARERQAQADNYYQKKIQDAHKKADQIILDFQQQGKELLEQARNFAQEIRDEVDVLSRKLREDARLEAEAIVDEGRKEAESIKHDAYEKALTKAEIEAEDLVVSAKAESNDILESAQKQAEEMLSKARNEMESELKHLLDAIDDRKKEIQHYKKEQEELAIKALGEKEEMDFKLNEVQTELRVHLEQLEAAQRTLNESRTEEASLQEKIRDQKKASEELEHQIGTLYGDSKSLERKNKDMQEQLGLLALDIQACEEQKKMLETEVNQQKSLIKDRLEREHVLLVKESEERMHESQIDMSKRLQKLEQEMFEEILGRKESLVKDIIVIIETRITKVLEPTKWDTVSSLIFEGISEVLEGKAVSINSDSNSKAPKQSVSLQKKKKKENLTWMGAGVAAGVLACVLGIQTYNRVTSDKNPMRTLAAEESRRRQEDLERRRFNPPQVRDVKDTYTDAVIYTSGYVQAYQDPDYQQKLYKAASTYLLKTWRVDEDKSIQVLSMSSALIKELNDKKAAIHPDYVKDGIQKMRNLEKESLDRMKTVLGSEVRLESYRRFEKKFFETEILKK